VCCRSEAVCFACCVSSSAVIHWCITPVQRLICCICMASSCHIDHFLLLCCMCFGEAPSHLRLSSCGSSHTWCLNFQMSHQQRARWSHLQQCARACVDRSIAFPCDMHNVSVDAVNLIVRLQFHRSQSLLLSTQFHRSVVFVGLFRGERSHWASTRIPQDSNSGPPGSDANT